MNKKIVGMLAIGVLSFMAVGCGSTNTSGANSAASSPSTNSAGKKQLIVGFSQMEMNNPWRIAETKSIKDEAKKRGIKLIYTDAQSSTAKQVSDVESMINQKVDYIILAPREYNGLAPALAEAKKAHIPVILVDRKAKGVPGQDYVTFIGSDFVKEGQRVADWLIKDMHGKGNVVELEGTPGSSVAIDRHNGFANELKAKAPDMKIIASQDGEFARANGQKVMENLLQSYGNKINAVYAQNDEMAIGAINAIKAAGKVPGKDITVVSIDGEKDGLKAILKGEEGAITQCSPFFGPAAFDVIEKLQKGESVPTQIINHDNFYTKANAAKYLNSSF